jgi:predicted nucleic acid-binding protein
VAGYLLDTNVLSETRKARADSGVIAFLTATGGS